VRAALGVFEGGHARFKAALQALRERAAMDLRYEDAIVYRDTLKALDRCISGLEIVRAATSARGSAIVERSGEDVTVLLVRHGRVAAIVRGMATGSSRQRFERRLRAAARRAYAPHRMAEDAQDLTGRQLRELFIVDAYRRHVRPVELPRVAGPDELVDAVLARIATDSERADVTRRGAPSGARR
jgi:excinuclease UvrABC nuclease subunit